MTVGIGGKNSESSFKLSSNFGAVHGWKNGKKTANHTHDVDSLRGGNRKRLHLPSHQEKKNKKKLKLLLLARRKESRHYKQRHKKHTQQPGKTFSKSHNGKEMLKVD